MADATFVGDKGTVFVGKGVLLDAVRPNLIEIGDFVTIVNGAAILTHDASKKNTLGYTLYGKVIIEDYVFIGARAVLLPGTRIGWGSIIGAGSVVTSGTDVPPLEVWAGSPARKVGDMKVPEDPAYLDAQATEEVPDNLQPLQVVKRWAPRSVNTTFVERAVRYRMTRGNKDTN